MTTKKVRSPSVFLTATLLELTGLTRRQLQRLEDAGAVRPLLKGGPGRGHGARWSLMQIIGCAYGKAFLDAGCLATWAWAACKWVSARPPGKLDFELHCRPGRFLLALTPDGQGKLIEPYLRPDATREQRNLVAALDLRPLYDRLLRQATAAVWRHAEEGR